MSTLVFLVGLVSEQVAQLRFDRCEPTASPHSIGLLSRHEEE
jgi:hypothetical protein